MFIETDTRIIVLKKMTEFLTLVRKWNLTHGNRVSGSHCEKEVEFYFIFINLKLKISAADSEKKVKTNKL